MDSRQKYSTKSSRRSRGKERGHSFHINRIPDVYVEFSFLYHVPVRSPKGLSLDQVTVVSSLCDCPSLSLSTLSDFLFSIFPCATSTGKDEDEFAFGKESLTSSL